MIYRMTLSSLLISKLDWPRASNNRTAMVCVTDLALQLQSFEFDLSELRLTLGFPQSDRHQFVLQLVHGVLLRGLLPVAAPATRAAAAGHVVLRKSEGVSQVWSSPAAAHTHIGSL